LRPFDANEWTVMQAVAARAADCVECWAREGLPVAMSRFNG
jgi:hypothetical protein